MKRWLGISLSILALSLGSSGCKELNEGQESDTKTLDNFAAGKIVNKNVCSGTNTVPRDYFAEASFADVRATATGSQGKITEADLDTKVIILTDDGKQLGSSERSAVVNAYQALPREVQDMFLAFKGKIFVTDNVETHCGSMYSSKKDDVTYMSNEARNKINSCWRSRTVSGRPWLEVILPNNAPGIAHNLVRTFGYLISQYWLNMEATDSVLSSLQSIPQPVQDRLKTAPVTYVALGDQEFTNLKKKLFEKFLEDAHEHQNADFRLANMDHLFGAQAAKHISGNMSRIKQAANARGSLQAYLEGTAFHGDTNKARFTGRAYHLASFAFAEAADSAWCSNKSRSVLQSEFKLVNALWSNSNPNEGFASKKYPGAVGAEAIVRAHLKAVTAKLKGNPNAGAPVKVTSENILGQRLSASVTDPTRVPSGPDSTNGVGNAANDLKTPPPSNQLMEAHRAMIAAQQAVNKANAQAMMFASLAPTLSALGSGLNNAIAQAGQSVGQAGCPNCNCASCANGHCACQGGCNCAGGNCSCGCANCNCGVA